MKITTTSYAVFACHSAACAPPPAGKGGSTPSAGGSANTFKNVHHARATHRKLAAKTDRTPEEEVRMKAALAVVRANDSAYGRRKAAERGTSRRQDDDDDAYDRMRDDYLTGHSSTPVTRKQREQAAAEAANARRIRRYGGM